MSLSTLITERPYPGVLTLTTTWAALAGDTSSFAIELSFLTDYEAHKYDADERASWGSFALWVNGTNVTEHTEEGETLRATHWYLLPVIEWFVGNWDALLHEERLPLNNAGPDAATAMTRLLNQPLGMVRPDLDEFDRLSKWQAWWSRHNVVESATGGIFPDIYIRRWGDLVELSVGSTVAPGTPSHFSYRNANSVGFVPVNILAPAVHDVLTRAIAELSRRRPDSPRIQHLTAACEALMDPDGSRYPSRLALLSGVDTTDGAALEQFNRLWDQVDETLDHALEPAARLEAIGMERGGLVLETAPQVALLFGTYSPTVTPDDVQVLIRSLHNVLSGRRGVEVPTLEQPPFTAQSPGEEGSQLGEVAYRVLIDSDAQYVDVEQVLDHLGITHSLETLSDRNVRAVTLLSKDYGAHIAVNENYLRGTTERVRRFTLAHELGHILLDRSRSTRLAIVSGPWAPRIIEQRANAFAAAFLMPEQLIERNAKRLKQPLWNKRAVEHLTASLRVSTSSLADRMYNLLLITREEADSIAYARRV